MPSRFRTVLGIGAITSLFLSSAAWANGPNETEPLSRFEVPISDYGTMSNIGREFSIEGGHDDVVNVYVPWSRHRDLYELAPDAELVEEDVDAWMRNLTRADMAGYRSYDEYKTLLDTLEQKYPELVKVQNESYMVSKGGKRILALKITKKVEKEHPNRPNVVITGATHGDEWSSTAIPMNVMEEMLEKYGSDPRVTRIFDRVNTYWVPIMSPDSFHRSRNVHGVDPNRVYPYPGRDRQPQIKSARAFMQWYEALKPKGVIDFHAFHGSIIWPWGCSRKSIAAQDKQEYIALAEKMIAKTGYRHGQVTKVLYDAPGISIDAWYNLHKTIAYTIEVGGSSKKPSESSLAKLIEDNREHIYVFFEHFIKGEPEPEEDESKEEDSGKDSDGEEPSEEEDKPEPSEESKEKEDKSEQEPTPEDPSPSPEPSESEKSEDTEPSSSSEPSEDPSQSEEASKDAQDSEKDKEAASSGCQTSSGFGFWGLGGLLGLAWRRRKGTS